MRALAWMGNGIVRSVEVLPLNEHCSKLEGNQNCDMFKFIFVKKPTIFMRIASILIQDIGRQYFVMRNGTHPGIAQLRSFFYGIMRSSTAT